MRIVFGREGEVFVFCFWLVGFVYLGCRGCVDYPY